MSDRPEGCVAGCMAFDGGERKHHRECAHYPESLTKLWHDTEAELQARIEELEAQLAEVTAEYKDFENEVRNREQGFARKIGDQEVRAETYRAAIPVAYQMALDNAFKNMKTFAPHEEHNTGPEHDIGYANGYHVAMNRIRALTPPADLVEQVVAKVKP